MLEPLLNLFGKVYRNDRCAKKTAENRAEFSLCGVKQCCNLSLTLLKFSS